MTTKLQGTIESIRQVIATIGPATARQIETHPEVVAACRSSKAKARRLIERLNAQGHIYSTGDAQQPKYWVQQAEAEKTQWDYDDEHNRMAPWKPGSLGTGEGQPCFTVRELAQEFGVTQDYLRLALRTDPNAPKNIPVSRLSNKRRYTIYLHASEARQWWANRNHTRGPIQQPKYWVQT